MQVVILPVVIDDHLLKQQAAIEQILRVKSNAKSSSRVKYPTWGHDAFNKMKLVCSPFTIPFIFHHKSVNGWQGTHAFTLLRVLLFFLFSFI